MNKTYALITAARNEEAYIRTTLEAVVKQTLLPKIWVIVSDGSTDRTEEYVRDYAGRHSFIRLIRLESSGMRAFSNQASAANAGYDSISATEFDFVGFLDADISFDPNYYEDLVAKFEMNPRLGVAGGSIVENRDGRFDARFGDSTDHVAGAVQFFRRQCYEQVGGLVPLRWGGHDDVAAVMARRAGWDIRCFSDLRVFHHRPTGSAGTTLRRARFREGMQDYFMGYHFLFEAGKCLRRAVEPPYVIGSFLRLCGYLWPGIRRQRPSMPEDFVRYLRQEQKRRFLQAVIGR
jgi:glycosyltransferase involved in cell wall biosynthesis